MMPLFILVHKKIPTLVPPCIRLLLAAGDEDGHGDFGSHILKRAGPLSAWVPE